MIKTWRDIPGFFDFQDVYDQAVAEAHDGDTLVEVGTFLGKSAAYMAERILEARKSVTFFAVDSWDPKQYANWWIDVRQDPPSPWPVEELYGMPLNKAFSHCIHAVGAQRLIVPFRSPSVQGATRFHDQSLSFVFIDANHLYDGISADISAWAPKIKPGGILAGHDYRTKAWPDVTRAVDETFGERVEHRNNSWLVRMP